jgi:hypothetical protein
MKTRFSARFVMQTCSMAILFFMLAACGGGQATKSDTEPVVKDPLLNKRYSAVILQKVDIDQQIQTDNPTAVADYEKDLLSELRSKNIVAETESQAVPKRKKQNTLIVKTKVVSLRIVSGSSRFWFGAMAGKSDMVVEIKLMDEKTGNVVREKVLSTANNPFGAVWVAGSSDKSLPADMGRIVASYILAIMPAK